MAQWRNEICLRNVWGALYSNLIASCIIDDKLITCFEAYLNIVYNFVNDNSQMIQEKSCFLLQMTNNALVMAPQLEIWKAFTTKTLVFCALHKHTCFCKIVMDIFVQVDGLFLYTVLPLFRDCYNCCHNSWLAGSLVRENGYLLYNYCYFCEFKYFSIA